MRNKNTISCQLGVIGALLLTACSTNLPLQQAAEPVLALEMETADLAEVKNDALMLAQQVGKDKVLVVFDIDNTILAMEQGLGADQWYEWQKALDEHDQCSPQNVGDRFAVQGALYFVNAMRVTQHDGADQIGAIQDQGITVIALTSRGMDYQLQTFRELRRNRISFAHSAFGPPGGFAEPFIPVEEGRLSLYEDGVFMTAGQHKGQMLYSLLKKAGVEMPAVIVMVDDKRKNLDAVRETFDTLEIPVHAWRYNGEDDNVEHFDPEQASAEWTAIEAELRVIQKVLGPDNYDLSSAVRPDHCQ